MRRTRRLMRKKKYGGYAAIRRALVPLARQGTRLATTRRNIYTKPAVQFAKHVEVPNINVSPYLKNTENFAQNVVRKIPKSFTTNPYLKNFALMPGEEEEMQQEFSIRN